MSHANFADRTYLDRRARRLKRALTELDKELALVRRERERAGPGNRAALNHARNRLLARAVYLESQLDRVLHRLSLHDPNIQGAGTDREAACQAR